MLGQLGNAKQKPTPIAVTITSTWIFNHEQAFEWITSQQWLDITLVNHYFSHPYHSDIEDIKNNFLN